MTVDIWSMNIIIAYTFCCDNLWKSVIMALEKPGKLREFFSPTLCHPVLYNIFHWLSSFFLLSIASSLHIYWVCQSFSMTSLWVFFSLPLGLKHSTSKSRHLFAQSFSSFLKTCPYHLNLCRCITAIINQIHSSSRQYTNVLKCGACSVHVLLNIDWQPGHEWVQELVDISRLALCCHRNETCASIENPPNSAQLEGTPYHNPKLHPGPCSTVGMQWGTDRHTQRWP